MRTCCTQWEIFSTVDSGCELIVALNAAENAAFHTALVEEFDSIKLSMSKIDTRRAEAFHERDRKMIEAAVQSSPGGFEVVNGKIHDCLRGWLASEGRRALEMCRATLGNDDAATLELMNNLSNLLKDQGKYSEAEPLYRESLRGCRQTLGEKHPSTLGSLSNLANLLRHQGKLSEAEPLCHDVLSARRETLGETHSATLSSLYNLAMLLFRQGGKYGEAELLFREALRGQLETLGKKHPETLDSLHNLANLLSDQDKHGEAETLYRDALRVQRETLGDTHPDTLRSLNGLNRLLEKLRLQTLAQAGELPP